MGSEASGNLPTPEMIAFYERRTQEHIERVRRCLAVMAEVVAASHGKGSAAKSR